MCEGYLVCVCISLSQSVCLSVSLVRHRELCHCMQLHERPTEDTQFSAIYIYEKNLNIAFSLNMFRMASLTYFGSVQPFHSVLSRRRLLRLPHGLTCLMYSSTTQNTMLDARQQAIIFLASSSKFPYTP